MASRSVYVSDSISWQPVQLLRCASWCRQHSTMLDCPRREQMLRLFAAKKAGMALGWGRVEVGLSIQQVEKKTVKKIMVQRGAVNPIITNLFLWWLARMEQTAPPCTKISSTVSSETCWTFNPTSTRSTPPKQNTLQDTRQTSWSWVERPASWGRNGRRDYGTRGSGQSHRHYWT